MRSARVPRCFRSVSGLALLAACVAGVVPYASDAQAAARNPRAAHEADGAPSSRALRHHQNEWADALKAEQKGDFRRAARILAKRDDGDALAVLYRDAWLARVRLRAGDTAQADAALAAALASPEARDVGWQRHLHRLRLRTSSVLPPQERKAYLLAAASAPLDNNDKAEACYRLLALDTVIVPAAERAEHARRLVTFALPGERFEREYRRWVAQGADVVISVSPDGRDTVRGPSLDHARLLLDAAEKLTLWDEAIVRATALAGRDTSEVNLKPLYLRIAQYHYNKGSYAKAAEHYLAYRARFGETPAMLIQLARSYRALSQDKPAQAWYTRLVERFPKDGRAAEVLWMRAFEDEMAGRHESAAATYARIARDFPGHARSGEAMFRRGLVEYRRGDFPAARQAFSALRLARKSGRLTGAAHYWEGKAWAAAGGEHEARAVWADMTRDFPFGHYGHLARQELGARGDLPDSLAWARMLNKGQGDAVRAWFYARPGASDTAKAARDAHGESAWMPVERLFGLGLDTLAVLTLQARANRAPDDLWLVYDAAVRCRKAGFGYEAYRFGLRLSDRLPLAEWPSAPVEVLRLFYPPSYAELVVPEARRAGIPPSLVLALIKQESGFDPRAVSRVGARGLMQLMPATGTEQARREGMQGFHPDSLFDPAVNIRLGVAYLRDVLKRHDGNIEYALAHYNAGPTALARWIPRLQNRPPEEAVEDIGYAETREYVKRVGANYKTYQVLWEGVEG